MVLLAVSALLAGLSAWVHPRRAAVSELLASAPEWSVERLQRERARGTEFIWVDARRKPMEQGGLRAVFLGADWDAAEAELLNRWREGLLVVVTTEPDQAERARLAARRLNRELHLAPLVVCVAGDDELRTFSK